MRKIPGKRMIFLRAAVLLLIANLALSCVFMGAPTFAKYIAAGGAEVTARVAKFSFKVTDEGYDFDEKDWVNNSLAEVAITAGSVTDFYLPLFSANYLKHDATVAAGTYTVVSKDGAPLIAPGTDSEINGTTPVITVKNESEVSVRYRILYDGKEGAAAAIPILLGSDALAKGASHAVGTEFYTWQTLAPNSAAVARKIFWEVPFLTMTGIDDAADTARGKAAAGGVVDLKLKFRLEVEQVD